jgi:hypothetical protein
MSVSRISEVAAGPCISSCSLISSALVTSKVASRLSTMVRGYTDVFESKENINWAKAAFRFEQRWLNVRR